MSADARLVAAHEFLRKGEANAEGWSMLIAARGLAAPGPAAQPGGA